MCLVISIESRTFDSSVLYICWRCKNWSDIKWRHLGAVSFSCNNMGGVTSVCFSLQRFPLQFLMKWLTSHLRRTWAAGIQMQLVPVWEAMVIEAPADWQMLVFMLSLPRHPPPADQCVTHWDAQNYILFLQYLNVEYMLSKSLLKRIGLGLHMTHAREW